MWNLKPDQWACLTVTLNSLVSLALWPFLVCDFVTARMVTWKHWVPKWGRFSEGRQTCYHTGPHLWASPPISSTGRKYWEAVKLAAIDMLSNILISLESLNFITGNKYGQLIFLKWQVHLAQLQKVSVKCPNLKNCSWFSCSIKWKCLFQHRQHSPQGQVCSMHTSYHTNTKKDVPKHQNLIKLVTFAYPSRMFLSKTGAVLLWACGMKLQWPQGLWASSFTHRGVSANGHSEKGKQHHNVKTASTSRTSPEYLRVP